MPEKKIITKSGEILSPFEVNPIFQEFVENTKYNCVPQPMQECNKKLPNVKNPVVNELQTLRTETETQTKELQCIRYENMKLNAQIETLNKTIDSQKDELDNLRNINAKLESTNKLLSSNSLSLKDWKHMLASFISGIIVTVVGGVILYFYTG